MDTKKIITAIKNGDQSPLSYIYEQYGKYCITSLQKYRNTSREEAEDLFIDAVMILQENILSGRLSELSSLKSYLYKVCENNYLARLKQQKRQQEKLDDVAFFFYESNERSETEQVFDEVLGKATAEAWATLSEKCKDILYYFYVDRLRMEQIASLLNFASADTAKTTKSRCYKKLVAKANQVMEGARG